MSAGRPSHGRLYLLLLLMVTLWSFNYVAGKIALREFPPLLLVCLRTAFAGALLLPVYLWREGARAVPPWRELRILLPLGVLGIAGNQMLFVLGLARTSVAHAAVVLALSPIIVLVLGAVAGQEAITKGKLAGIAIAFSGVAVLQMGPGGGARATLLGDALVLACALTMATFTVLSKSIGSRYGGITMNTVAYAGAALLLAPLAWQQSAAIRYASITATGWWSLFYMAAFASVIAYLIFYHALRHISASRVSVFTYLQPVFATLMAIPILREPVHPGLLLGGSLTLAGVFLTERF